MDKICGIYKIENIITKECYIGSSKDIEKRVNGHVNRSYSKHSKNFHIYNAFRKYGCENFVYEILIQCHPDMLLWYEQLAMDRWKPEYNMGDRAGRIEMTDNIRSKISNAMKGRTLSEEHKRNLIGIVRSVETRRKMSESQIGKKRSDDAKRKMSEWQIGRKLSDERKRKMSEVQKERWRKWKQSQV